MKTAKKQVPSPCYTKTKKKRDKKRVENPFKFLPKGQSILLPHMSLWN